MEKLEKKAPKVLISEKRKVNERKVINWGKGTGGPYPWRKK